MGRRGQHERPGVTQSEIIVMLGNGSMKTGEIKASLRKLGIKQARGIKEHLRKLEKDGVITSDGDAPFIAGGKITKRDMRKELNYSLPDTFSGMYRTLTFVEKVDIKYLKSLVYSKHYTEFLTEFFNDDIINTFRDVEVESKLRELFESTYKGMNLDASISEEVLQLYFEIYERFAMSPRDLVRSLRNTSLVFPKTGKFLLSALAFLEIFEEKISAGNKDSGIPGMAEGGKMELFSNYLAAYHLFSPDIYAKTLYTKHKNIDVVLLFLTSVFLKMITEADMLDAVIPDFLFTEGLLPSYITSEVINTLREISTSPKFEKPPKKMVKALNF
ncbi:MAG: hypothetical protein QW292_11475 [Candidatus Parvarchaeota archaeon]